MTRPAYALGQDGETWYRIEETTRSGAGHTVVKSKSKVDETEVAADWRNNRLVQRGDFEVLE